MGGGGGFRVQGLGAAGFWGFGSFKKNSGMSFALRGLKQSDRLGVKPSEG